MSTDLSNGSVFAGRYRIERRIATGGMGAVYEVVHLETNRRRALKVMHENFVQSEELRNRFRQEARVAAEIESEYIVDVFDAGIEETTGTPFLVMELLRGEELAKRLRRTGPLSPAEVVTYLHQTALALEKTHRAAIVHRDLKPDNLFLCEREDGPPRVKVLDFGIAKMVAEGATQAQATRSLGTPLYMAPEQFVMDTPISPATDIFALGMIAFTLLVGKPYWHEEAKSGASVFAFAATAALGPQEAAVTRAEKLGVTLPPAFNPWFAQITARKPSDRFTSALLAVRGLADALGVPLPGPQPSPSGAFGPSSVSSPNITTPLGPPPSVRAPMQSHNFLQVATPMPLSSPSSTGGVSTPIGSVATPFSTGSITAAPVQKPKPPYALIAAGAVFGVAALSGLVYFATASTSSTSAEVKPATAPEPSAAPAPTPTPQPEAKTEASAPSQPAASTATTPSAAPSTTAPDLSKSAGPFKTTKPGSTAATKKPLWTND